MHKRSVYQRIVLLAGFLALALVALIGGSFVLPAAYAAHSGSAPGTAAHSTSAAQSGCDQKIPGCEGNASSPGTKPGARSSDTPSLGGCITSISGTTVIVQAKNRVSTIHLTSATTFVQFNPVNKALQPTLRSALKVGQVIEAEGTLQSDGSLVASVVITSQ